jgi:uncharacterized protein
MDFIREVISISLTAAPWLLMGLLAAGFIKAFIPRAFLQRWLSGNGVAAVSRAAVIGAPLPLCSCGAIPTALTIYRKGAGRGPTIAFLIGTPGIGIDSVLISYALLGPLMALSRALGAVITAISTGLLVSMTLTPPPFPGITGSTCTKDCGPGTCPGGKAGISRGVEQSTGVRLKEGMRYVFNDLFRDIIPWMLLGLMIAGLLMAFVPPHALAAYGSGFLPMLLMAVVGIPLYICATAATPIGAGLLMAGVSPGTVLVFLLAGPITSTATLGVLRREMGNPALACYLSGIIATTVVLGLMVDQLVIAFEVNVVAQVGAAGELLPQWLEWTALFVLLAISLPWFLRIISGKNSPAKTIKKS